MHLSTPPPPLPHEDDMFVCYSIRAWGFSSLQVANNKRDGVCSYWSWIFQETLVHSSSVYLYLLSMNWQKCSSKVTSSEGVYIFTYCISKVSTTPSGSLKNSTIVTLHFGICALGSLFLPFHQFSEQALCHTQLLCPSLLCGSRIQCLGQSESVSQLVYNCGMIVYHSSRSTVYPLRSRQILRSRLSLVCNSLISLIQPFGATTSEC